MRVFTCAYGGDILRPMKATHWEFTNRAMLFGLIFAFSFPLYFLDHQNPTVALADWIASGLQVDADLVARLLFAFAALLLVVAALIHTWASSYLHAGVVYAAEVKTASLVARFKAESWYWGFAVALVAFAITLKLTLFFAILAGSLALFWFPRWFFKRMTLEGPVFQPGQTEFCGLRYGHHCHYPSLQGIGNHQIRGRRHAARHIQTHHQ
jgi:hypothetical protein